MAKKNIIIKIGSSNLVKDGKVDIDKMNYLSNIIKKYKGKDYEFIIVSSGAVAIGKERMKTTDLVLKTKQKQAMAAIGQPLLMKKYDEAFSKNDIITAQVLLTRDDLENRKRYIKARDTLLELLEFNVVPIINENDTVSTKEIKIGDNDNLSARVATAVEADILIVLSDIDGLYDKNPSTNPNANLISEVKELTDEIWKNAGGSGSSVGTGGMVTKLEAAEICMKVGTAMYIINGKDIGNLEKVLNDEQVGTKFIPNEKIVNRKKMWIGYSLRAQGRIYIDDGAEEALKNGKSLLPSGITRIKGSFEVGDMVSVYNKKRKEIARGIVNYNSEDIFKIERRRSEEIEELLGYKSREEVIHRDNMIII